MSVDTTDDHEGHHLPAVEDWPAGFGEASWWPFVTALGASGIYVAAALFVLGRGEEAILPAMYGPAAFLVSLLAFLVGLYGWVYHAFVVNFWEHGTGDHGGRALRFAMLLFLGTEIATFGGGFVYYFFIRAGAWSAEGLPHLLSSLVLVNTGILVVSSFTLHYAHVALRKNKHKRFLQLLGVTLALGVVFIGGQVLEYYEFIVNEGFTIAEGAFASAFFGLTGLHGLHVSLGAVLLAILFVRGYYGQYDAERHTSVSTVSMYWHFVDLVWIFLVAVLYVGAVASI